MKLTKEDILKHIIDQEMEFFEAMNKEEEIPENTIPALRRMRWMTYVVLSEETLKLWLIDLLQARESNRNTMIEKYALIDGLIDPIQINPVIEKIATAETEWMEELAKEYPLTVQGHDSNKELFKKYILCELQSWSKEALDSYWQDICRAKENNENLAIVRYDCLYNSLGKGSLAEVNKSLKEG